MESYKKFNEKAQTANFSDLTRQRPEALCWKRQKTPKLKKLKRKLLKILKRYDLSRVVPCRRARPEDSENVVVFEIWRFQTIVIGCQSQVKFREKYCLERGVVKKRHGHNFEFWVLKRIAGPSHMVGRTCYSFQGSKLIIVAVSFFRNASYFW